MGVGFQRAEYLTCWISSGCFGPRVSICSGGSVLNGSGAAAMAGWIARWIVCDRRTSFSDMTAP